MQFQPLPRDREQSANERRLAQPAVPYNQNLEVAVPVTNRNGEHVQTSLRLGLGTVTSWQLLQKAVKQTHMLTMRPSGDRKGRESALPHREGLWPRSAQQVVWKAGRQGSLAVRCVHNRAQVGYANKALGCQSWLQEHAQLTWSLLRCLIDL